MMEQTCLFVFLQIEKPNEKGIRGELLAVVVVAVYEQLLLTTATRST